MNLEEEKRKVIYRIQSIHNQNLDKEVSKKIEQVLKKYPDCYMKVRIKEEKSAIKKMEIRNFSSADQIGDLLGIMIVTKNKEEIYEIEKELKKIWEDTKIEDYIENPKYGYQSLHMNCKLNSNIPIEIQIKTEEMRKAQEVVHESIYKNENLEESTRNILSSVIYDKLFHDLAKKKE